MKWIDDVRGSDSIREVARRVGMNQGTLNRQVNLDQVSYDTVRDIAREYGRPVLADLVYLGHLSHDDLGVDDVASFLRSVTEEQLVYELGCRLGVSGSILFDAPISAAVASASNIVHGRFPATDVGASDDDEAAVARQADDDRGEDA